MLTFSLLIVFFRVFDVHSNFIANSVLNFVFFFFSLSRHLSKIIGWVKMNARKSKNKLQVKTQTSKHIHKKKRKKDKKTLFPSPQWFFNLFLKGQQSICARWMSHEKISKKVLGLQVWEVVLHIGCSFRVPPNQRSLCASLCGLLIPNSCLSSCVS